MLPSRVTHSRLRGSPDRSLSYLVRIVSNYKDDDKLEDGGLRFQRLVVQVLESGFRLRRERNLDSVFTIWSLE